MATTFPTLMTAKGGSGNAFKDTTFAAPGEGGGGSTLASSSSSNGRSPGDDALSSLQTLWGTPKTSSATSAAGGTGGEFGDVAIAGHGSGGGGGGGREAAVAPSNRDPSSDGRDFPTKPERSVLRRTPSVRCAVDAYATRVLRSASPPEMRDAVDESLGPYITSLLRDIVGDGGDGSEATTSSMLEQPPPRLTALDEYDNLIELVVEHCGVSTPGVATEALEAIYDAVCTGRIPPASPPAGGDGDVVETQRKSPEAYLADVSSFRAATLDPWSTDAAAAEGEVLLQQRKLQTYVDNGKAADRALVQVTPEDVDEDLEKLVGRMVFTDEEEEEDGGANHRLASDLLAVMDESSSFEVLRKKPNADLESTTTTSSTEEGERTPSQHQALHTIAPNDGMVNVNAELAAVTGSSAGDSPGGRIDGDSCGGEKQQINARDGSGGKKKRGSVNKNNDSEAKDLAAALFRPARPRSNSNLSDGNKRRSPTFGTGNTGVGSSGGTGGGANAAYPSYPLPPSSSPPTYPTVPPGHSTNMAYSKYQQHYNPNNYASDVLDPSSCLPQDRQRHHPPPPGAEDNLQLYHLASEQLLTYNPDLSPEAAWEASTLAGGDVQLAYQIIDQAANATPVCRHMLSHACYRSDCQFSHDVEGHTCAFWLRGRCGKGEECRFLHGFHERTLQGATTAAAAAGAAAASVSGKPPQPPRPRPHSFLSNPSTSPALTGGSGVGVGVGVGRIDTDRQRHLLGSEFLDGTLSDWDNDERAAGAGGSGSGGNNDTTSFASIASRGGGAIGLAPDSSSPAAAAFAQSDNTYDSSAGSAMRRADRRNIRTVRIPQHLWNASINRNPELFYVEDPIERYYAVNSPSTSSGSRAPGGGNGDDVVMDLHFQSEKTAPIVLAALLPEKLRWRGTAPARSDYDNGSTIPRGVWIVTGSGHHVNERSHQRGGGVLENAVMDWLDENEFEYYRGKDRNGYGGAVLVVR